MRLFLIFLQLFFTSVIALSQSDTITNSFEEVYKRLNPSINYKYNYEKQVHDYSNNWDFDKDDIPDQVYFIGTGGAHLWYFLRIILSTDKVVRNYSFIQSDLPLLPSDEEVRKTDFNPKTSRTKFTVFNYSSIDSKVIFVKLDNSLFNREKYFLRRKGIKTNLLIVTFKDGKTIFKDFVDKLP